MVKLSSSNYAFKKSLTITKEYHFFFTINNFQKNTCINILRNCWILSFGMINICQLLFNLTSHLIPTYLGFWFSTIAYILKLQTTVDYQSMSRYSGNMKTRLNSTRILVGLFSCHLKNEAKTSWARIKWYYLQLRLFSSSFILFFLQWTVS